MFQLSSDMKPFTRCVVLSTVNGLYGPFGFAAPVVIWGKALIRELMTESHDWDALFPLLLFHAPTTMALCVKWPESSRPCHKIRTCSLSERYDIAYRSTIVVLPEPDIPHLRPVWPCWSNSRCRSLSWGSSIYYHNQARSAGLRTFQTFLQLEDTSLGHGHV